MTATVVLLLSLICETAVAIASDILITRANARKLYATYRCACRLEPAAPPPVDAALVRCAQQSAPALVEVPPPKPAPGSTPYTSFEISDRPPLVQRCVCGEVSLYVGLLTAHSVCTKCCRVWSSVRGRSFFVPVTLNAQFSKFNGLHYGEGQA